MIWLTSRLRRALRAEGGFTLIELVAAMAVFMLAAGAVISVLLAGMSTASFARDRTIGKDLARQQVEEMRRLPFYLAFSTFPRKADLLDTYYPDSGNLSPSGYDATNPADPFYKVTIDPVPGYPRYRFEIVSRFLDADLNAIPPDSGYRYNDPGNDRPPSVLLSVEVLALWRSGNRQSRFLLQTQMGATRLEEVTVAGSVTTTMLRVDTRFDNGTTFLAEVGRGNSNIHEAGTSTARNESQAASARLVSLDGTTKEMRGISLLLGAPPDVGPTSTPTSSDINLVYDPTFLEVARLGPSQIKNVLAKVTSVPPTARGEVLVREAGFPGDRGFGATNQVQGDYNFLDSNKEFVRVVKVGASPPLRFDGNCTTTTASPQTVSCESSGSLQALRLIPTRGWTSVGVDDLTANNGYLVSVTLTSVRVRAVAARPGGGGTASVLAEFAGTVSLWTWLEGVGWSENPFSIQNGLANPLPDLSTCIALRTDGTCVIPLSAYISSWKALSNGTTNIADGGRRAEASLPGVVTIATTSTSSIFAEGGFTLLIGDMKAQANDRR